MESKKSSSVLSQIRRFLIPEYFFYHLSSISRYLMKNSLSSIVKLRKLSFFELKFSVKSVH